MYAIRSYYVMDTKKSSRSDAKDTAARLKSTDILSRSRMKNPVTGIDMEEKIIITSYSIHYTKLYDCITPAAFFVSINLMAKDMERKTLFFVLSKPFSRGEYILGKLFGLILLSTAAVGVLCFAASASVFITRSIYPNHFNGFAWRNNFV